MITPEMQEAVKAVAELIKQSDEFKKVMEKQKAYNESTDIATYMTEYGVQQEILSVEFGKPERDEDLIAKIQARIDNLYDEIVSNPVYQEYKDAADEYSAYYQEVVSELDFAITGKKASCSGDCSSCGGCH